MLPTILECDARTTGQLADRARHEHLVRRGSAGHPRPDVDCDPAELGADSLDLAHVQAGPHLDSEVANAAPNCEGAGDRIAWRLESREESVPGGVELAPPVAAELASDVPIEVAEELAPRPVAEPRRDLR